MGIIQQQTIKGTIYSYLGVFVGAISINIIQPHALTTEQIGLTGILISFSTMFAQFSTLGFSGTSRYFPYFRSEENKHHGYLFLFCLIALIGTVLFTVALYLFKSDIISEDSQKSPLFEEYFWYFIPLIFFTVYFNVFDLYARLLYNSISGKILREFTKRLLIMLVILLIYFKLVSFNWFMILWLVANIVPTLILAGRLVVNKQFFFKPDFKFLEKDMKRKLTNISLLGMLTGSLPIIVENIDKYIINQKYGLSDTGIYTIAFFFATIITLPSRSLSGIATTVVAESWKSNDTENIKMVYKKSCINQLIAALFLFIIIWANVDNFFTFLPQYKTGKYVVLFIGIGNLIDSATGVNSIILNTSKYYKYDGLFYLPVICITILGNLWLTPIYGLAGAAIATAFAFLCFNVFRYVFIYRMFKMQPFTLKNLYTLAVGLLVYALSVYLIPQGENYIIDTFIRTGFITLLYWVSIYSIKASDDINLLFKGYIVKLKSKG